MRLHGRPASPVHKEPDPGFPCTAPPPLRDQRRGSDVTPIRVGGARLYVGLPYGEGGLIAELLAGGDVGYELSLDPDVPIVVGVYPMRPVPRS